MKTANSPITRIMVWLQTCAVMFMALGLLLAWGAALTNSIGKAAERGLLTGLGFVGYVVLAGLLAWTLRRVQTRWGTARFLALVCLVSLAIQCCFIWLVNGSWAWVQDAGIFKYYLDALAANGYTQQTLTALSPHYDYNVWTYRALPFYYGIRLVSGASFVLNVQLFQALIITLSLLLTWRIARLCFGQRVAVWTVLFQLLMPFRLLACLDLNHHIMGGFYFVAGLWILVEWQPPGRRFTTRFGLAVAAFVLLPLMRLEGGIDLVWLASATLVFFFLWLARCLPLATMLRTLLVLVVIPLLGAQLLIAPWKEKINTANPQRHAVGMIGFMARGWAPETGGEYYGPYEVVDYLTPPTEKVAVQRSLLASQVVYNPGTLLGRLLPIKIAKYFLLGYASGTEEMMAAHGAKTAKSLAVGARMAWTIMALPLMIWGALLLLPRLWTLRRLPLVLRTALLAVSYIFFGETSPRYSIYIQPFLFMLAALPLGLAPSQRQQLMRWPGRPARIASLSIIAAGCAAGLLLWAGRAPLRAFARQDMRAWVPATDTQVLPVSATLAPLVLPLAPQPQATGVTWGTVRPPPPQRPPRALVFYALMPNVPSGHLRGARLLIRTPTETLTNTLPGRIRISYPEHGLGELQFGTEESLLFPLHIGYAAYEYP